MMPSNWGNVPEKPICRVCGCVEFGDDMICLGCGEPLVVRPYPKNPVINMIAAKKWGNHWPKDYESRCFLCGWKFRKTLDSLIPKDPEKYMAAGIWASRPEAKRLAEIIYPGKTLSQRLKMIIGILANNGDNAIFNVAANKEYAEMAEEYEGKKLFFCRKCAEEKAIPQPIETPVLTSTNLTDSMAEAMAKSKPMVLESIPVKDKFGNTHLAAIAPPSPKQEENDWDQDEEDWSYDKEENEKPQNNYIPPSVVLGQMKSRTEKKALTEEEDDWGDDW